MSNSKIYLTSNNLYTHAKHCHWLAEVKTVGLLRSLKAYENKIISGWALTSKNKAFAESIGYNHLIHELDVISGEYVNVLMPYARAIIKQMLDAKGINYDTKDLQWTTNFNSEIENTTENRRNGDYYKKGHYYFHAENNEMLCVSFKKAEDFAYSEQEAE